MMRRRRDFSREAFTSVLVAIAFAARVAAAQELAVVRTFASEQEVTGLTEAIALWNELLPCSGPTWVPVDLLLVYSQNFDLTPSALVAAKEVQSSFENGTAWAPCFRSVFIESANLSATEDVYDNRGYAIRKDWVNGPNSVFRFILGSFFNGTFPATYDSFYFMEIDAVPVRPFWLDQFIAEATIYPRAAIRGSRYRGDSWDSFQTFLPDDLLLHINGNAIYNLRHPWLRWLYEQLEEEQSTEFNAIAFDLRMANLSLEGRQGPNSSAAAVAWAEHVPSDEDAYRPDSLLVGNFANTLLNSSFDAGVYVRHGATSNIFENLNDSQVSLVAISFDGSSGVFDRFNQSLGVYHPFRKVLVISYGPERVAPAGTTQVVSGEAGESEITFHTGKKRQYKALCEAASWVTTEYFVFTDTYHIVSGPSYVLVDEVGFPVLPYIHRDSSYCQERVECVKSLDQAEALFGVTLNYHHDLFETVFLKNATLEFCNAWFDATLSLPSFKDCGLQYGPTANDYFAWQVSVQLPVNYVPKDKERVGFRPFSRLWRPHPIDPRNCSVYTETEYDFVLGNISECSTLGDNLDDCQASQNCTFRPLFSSGSCVPNPRFEPSWILPAAFGSTTITNTSSTTTTATASSTSATSTSISTSISSTSSSSTASSTTTASVTRSSTSTSSSTTSASTTFSSTTSATSSITSITITGTTQTQTTTTVTYTVLPGSCPAPVLSATADITACLGLFPGDSCVVSCAFGYTGQPEVYTCTQSEVFSGNPPTCVATTTTATLTTTLTILVLCEAGIPTGLGVDSASCVGLYNGETCTAGCVAPFEGGPVNLTCNPLSAQLEGPLLECKEKMCEVAQLPSNYSTAGCAERKVGEYCTVACPAGYTGQEALFECQADGTFGGSLPACQRTPCMPGGLPVLPGLNVSSCMYLYAGEACTVSCALGYEGTASTYQCDMAGDFAGTAPTCNPKSCDVPAEFFTSVRYNTTCAGVTHGQSCMTKCNQGYSGLPTQQQCFNGIFSGTTPTCAGNPCSFEGFALGKGVNASTCFGLVTQETCTLSCLRGHTIEGNSLTLTCQASGEFTATDAVCVPAQCGNISTVSPFDNASVADSCNEGGSFLQFGEVCFAFCEQGYSLDSNATLLQCEEAPVSSAGFMVLEGDMIHVAELSTGPTCTPKPCIRGIPDLRGTTNDCPGTVTGGTCSISSVLGFDMTGNVQLHCKADGSFTKDLPTVSPAVCPTPYFTDGVGSTCDNKTVGAECWAYCNPGFEGRPKPYQCQVNETANAVLIDQMAVDAVNCTNISTDTVTVAPDTNDTNGTNDTNDTNSTAARRLQASSPCTMASVAQVGLDGAAYFHDCTNKAHDEVCIAHCAQGWNMTQEEPSIFVCKSGFLVGASLPTCVPLPCSYSFPDGLGVRHNCLGVRSAESCEATCTEAGYTYAAGASAETWTCLPTGSLDGQVPTCQRIACIDLAINTMYSHNCQGKRFEDTCSVGCGPGFTLSGTAAQYQCQADGNITGSLPTCLGNPCSNTLPTDPAFDTSGCDSKTTGQTCLVTCNPGYTPNVGMLTCDTSGFLLGILPSCKPQPCPNNATLDMPSLVHTCEGVAYSGTCAAFCAPGYILSNGSAIEEWSCMRNAIGILFLSGTVPVCEPQACDSGLPVASPNLVDNCSALTTGQSCTQDCATGYSSTAGPNTYTCTEDGSATSSGTPPCQPVQCASNLGTNAIVHTCSGVTFGASCYAVCAPGYNSSQGPQTWDCAGPDSVLPAIPGLAPVADIVLRGTLLECSPQPCLYNLPYGIQYDHDCNNVKTDESCTVSCADGFVGAATVLICEGTRGLAGTMPTCARETATETSTTQTITSSTVSLTTSVTQEPEIPNLCLAELMPVIQGARGFVCSGPEGVGQHCAALCETGGEAAITCWSDKRWRVNEACAVDSGGEGTLIAIFVPTIAVLCLLVTLISGFLLYTQTKVSQVAPEVTVSKAAEEKSPGGKMVSKVETSPKSAAQSPLRGSKEKDSRDYAWAIASSRGYAHPWDMDFFAAESALRQSANNAWMAPPLPAAVPAAFNNGPSLSGLDQFAFQQSPPLLYTSLTRPAPPEQANSVLQVEEDAAFRVWVQQVPPADTLAAVPDTVP